MTPLYVTAAALTLLAFSILRASRDMRDCTKALNRLADVEDESTHEERRGDEWRNP